MREKSAEGRRQREKEVLSMTLTRSWFPWSSSCYIWQTLDTLCNQSCDRMRVTSNRASIPFFSSLHFNGPQLLCMESSFKFHPLRMESESTNRRHEWEGQDERVISLIRNEKRVRLVLFQRLKLCNIHATIASCRMPSDNHKEIYYFNWSTESNGGQNSGWKRIFWVATSLPLEQWKRLLDVTEMERERKKCGR